jgi:hypothetical protein
VIERGNVAFTAGPRPARQHCAIAISTESCPKLSSVRPTEYVANMEYESPPFPFGHAHKIMARVEVIKQLHALLLHADKRIDRRPWLKPMSTFLQLFIQNALKSKV